MNWLPGGGSDRGTIGAGLRRFLMRLLIGALATLWLAGCTALMVGGGSAATYPPQNDCPEGQTRSEDGCQE